ncbi:hypothetical protein IGI04_039609 [Brassica rapa subsp. trilocularis]|uniref:RNase H type-1 domain-containing protein n=1 Tax=Brassica rapa subsp. trilocularis TaxID=1813537 RepID=A0ABQ7KPT4_BRACM|nr:hypothetical protein IGI04_039609 [Brassica rapa subsp. trilocularis]
MSLTFTAFELNVQSKSSLLAESMAMREALNKCTELGLVSICFESDSSQLINAINEGKIPLKNLGLFQTSSFYTLHSLLYHRLAK